MDELPLHASSPDAAIAGVDVRAVAGTIVAGAAAIYAMREGAALLAPVLVGVLLAYALEPFVALLMRLRLPRPLAIAVLYLLLAAAFAGAAGLARRQILAFANMLPATVADLQRAMAEARQAADAPDTTAAMTHLQHAAAELNETLRGPAGYTDPGVKRVQPVEAPFDLRAYLAGSWTTIAATATQLAAVALLTLLLLLTGEALKRKLIAIAGPRAQKKVTHDVIKAIDRQIERYLLARLLISGIVAAATALGLWALGVGHAAALGVVAGVLNVMPFIGPAIAVGLAAVVTFLQFHTLGTTAAAIVVTGAVAALEGNLISPWLTSRAGELNTVAVFVSVLFWGWMWDGWGLVLAIPIMVAVKAAADHIEPLQPVGELLGR